MRRILRKNSHTHLIRYDRKISSKYNQQSGIKFTEIN